MIDKELEALTKLAAVVALASFAGFVNYLQRFAGDNAPAWSWAVAATKVFTAGFVGILTHWLLSGWGLAETHENLINFSIAVAGYGGAETIAFFQSVFQDVIRRAAQSSGKSDRKD